jgi:hypothetical protein
MADKRIPVPSAPGRIARTDEMRQNFEAELRAKEAAIAKRRELFNALSHFVSAKGAWLVSSPGDTVRIEAKPDSEVPDLLSDRGLNLTPAGTGTRIEGGRFVPVCIYTFRLPGK